ncbi:hypothetical protein [Ectopseudomonas oleovorans]
MDQAHRCDLASNLLKRMPDWPAAMEIIMQHQEHADALATPKACEKGR